ncbi:flagellar basal body P-ring protein FlgI, partial [Rickettsiales bacterium]|nr:flagellar basal body P-ring protein FlgI [Rickettsiales bacterium]
ASRIKDIVSFEGVRENILMGYGLVVGLNGSGDNLKNIPFTEKGLAEFLSRLGVNTKGSRLQTKNVAAVTLTGNLPSFSRAGNKFDVTVSALGDAKSLKGGVLLATPLLGADGNVYAVAQGPVVLGGLITTLENSNSKNNSIPTTGVITNGATVEREIEFDLSSLSKLNLALRNPDISTARRIAESVNDVVGEDAAVAIDPGTVEVVVPEIYGENVIGLLADIEQVIVQPDNVAKIIIDEDSGTIVIGEDVKVDTVAVAQGNLLITITGKKSKASEGFSFGADESNKEEAEEVQFSTNTEPGNGLAFLRQGANLRDLVSGLNALGVGTRDLITILRTIKVAGALHAEIETR